jgi:hypothetical protein
MRNQRVTLVAAAGLTLALTASSCSTAPHPERAILLWVEGSVVTTEDSIPIPQAFVRLTRGVDYSGSGAIAGTLTNHGGAFTIVANIPPAACHEIKLMAGTLGRDPSLTTESQLRCTSQCQRFEFALHPSPVVAQSRSDPPRVTSCKS